MRFVANGDFNMADHSKNVFFLMRETEILFGCAL